ncbi:hypothetical protein Hanom_Chr11g01027351 [Helianthus anomalus]
MFGYSLTLNAFDQHTCMTFIQRARLSVTILALMTKHIKLPADKSPMSKRMDTHSQLTRIYTASLMTSLMVFDPQEPTNIQRVLHPSATTRSLQHHPYDISK